MFSCDILYKSAADLGLQSFDRHVRMSPISFVYHSEASFAQHAVLIPVFRGFCKFVILDSLHVCLQGIFSIAAVLSGNCTVAGIISNVAHVWPNGFVQVEVYGQQTNKQNEAHDDNKIEEIDFPFFAKIVFVHVDDRLIRRRTSDVVQVFDLKYHRQTVYISIYIYNILFYCKYHLCTYYYIRFSNMSI